MLRCRRLTNVVVVVVVVRIEGMRAARSVVRGRVA